MALSSFGPRDEWPPRRPGKRAKRVAPIRSPADAASQIFDLYDAARKHHGDNIDARTAFYLTATLRHIADLRLTQAVAESVIDGFEQRLEDLEGKFDASELLK